MPGRNRVAVRACPRMAEKRADALIKLRADDVLELAGVRIRFGFGHFECVGEQPLREAPAPHDVARAVLTPGSQSQLILADLE